MATGKVTLRGRFSKGTIVRLFEVDGPHVLRPEGVPVAEETVEEVDGIPTVSFSAKAGQRYIAQGYDQGTPREVRLVGRESDDAEMTQAPVLADRVRMADGSWEDEKPKARETPKVEVAPGPAQDQVGDDVPQRSATWRGTAHPVDPDEKAPYRSQEDLPEGTPQSSDTRRRELEDGTVVGGGGAAAPIAVGPQRQEDVGDDVPQRSSTPTGIAYPIPKGNAVDVQRVKESVEGKELRGEPVRVSSEPIQGAKPPKGASQKQSEERHAEITKSDRAATLAPGVADQPTFGQPEGQVTDGRDAMGQPADPAVASIAGVEPAESPREPVRKKSPRKRSAKK